MIILYSLIALYIAWIWVDFFRLIDVYQKNSLKYFVLLFVLGCTSVLIVFGINKLIFLNFYLNGIFFNDFVYSVIKIGVIEEFAKLIPFIFFIIFFKSQLKEPIDYLAYISTSALGFSAVENILYFIEYGPSIINGRAILSTVGHMFDTALIAYGIILYKYHPNKKKNNILIILLFFILAALSHGIYDFWLIYENTKQDGWIITVIYFLITISLFAVILNNSLNNSSFFSYKKIISSNKIIKRLLTYYGIVFFIQLILLIAFKSFTYAFQNFTFSLITTGFIIFITSVRLSRFKLIKGRWHKLKIELPFEINRIDSYELTSTRFRLSIKGESFSETSIDVYYKSYFYLYPISKRNSYLGSAKLAYIEKKLFLKNDEAFYLVKVFNQNNTSQYEKIILKPKMANTTMINNKYPIVAVLKIDNTADIESSMLTAKHFKFREWAFLKPHSK